MTDTPFATRARALKTINRLNGSFRSQAVADRMAANLKEKTDGKTKKDARPTGADRP